MQYKVDRVEGIATVEKNLFDQGFWCQNGAKKSIKIHGANQPFFTRFWRENHKKYEIKKQKIITNSIEKRLPGEYPDNRL